MATDQEKESWALRSCAYCELVMGGATYVLSNGAWYQIDATFVTQVDQSVNRLLEATTLPDYLKTDKDEAAYNKRVAKAKGYFKFDRRNVYHGGRRRDQIEPCDLLTKQHELIHVKRYGGSSVLSHLFAQGLVSSDLLVDDATYREKMRNKISDAGFKKLIPEVVDASTYKVIYAIVGRSAGKKKLAEMLPFFSRVTLRRTAKQLKRMGYDVAVQWVTNTSPDA